MKIEHVEEICRDSFALWSSGFFSAISGWNPDLTFEEHKEAFFWLLKKLLDEGKVICCPPDDPLCRIHRGWTTSSDEIIAYWRAHWPESAEDENDTDLNFYFYEMPGIIWLGEDGKWYGS